MKKKYVNQCDTIMRRACIKEVGSSSIEVETIDNETKETFTIQRKNIVGHNWYQGWCGSIVERDGKYYFYADLGDW